VLTTKRRVIARVLVCQGCCGQMERGRSSGRVAEAGMEKTRLAQARPIDDKRLLGPCDVPNVVAVVTQEETVWLGNICRQDQYQSLLDWASRRFETDTVAFYSHRYDSIGLAPMRGLDRMERNLHWRSRELKKDGDTSIRLCSFADRASCDRFLRPWHRLFHSGWPSLVWFS
jgi:hypothetical protein